MKNLLKKLFICTSIFCLGESCLASELKEDDLTYKIIKSDRISEKTSNYMGYILSSHGEIEPDFMKSVYEKTSPVVLEIGPGTGVTLKKLLNDSRNEENPLNYTVVELGEENNNELKRMYLDNSKNKKNFLGCAKKRDVREYIKDKKDKFNLIYCAQVLHFFSPTDQLGVLLGFYKSLKEGGELYILTNSILICTNALKRHFPNDNEEEIIELGNKLVSQFVERRKKGALWAGVIETEENLHSVASLSKLLIAIGFDIIKSVHFLETCSKDTDELADMKVGIIARKTSESKPNLDLLGKYYNEASHKFFDIWHSKLNKNDIAKLMLGN